MTDTTTISTHVLDTARGVPAADIAVTLERADAPNTAVVISRGSTDADGRVPALVSDGTVLHGGAYRLRFGVASYFATTQRRSFYAEICIDFLVADDPQHYHVPLLLSPFGYSTYRGS